MEGRRVDKMSAEKRKVHKTGEKRRRRGELRGGGKKRRRGERRKK